MAGAPFSEMNTEIAPKRLLKLEVSLEPIIYPNPQAYEHSPNDQHNARRACVTNGTDWGSIPRLARTGMNEAANRGGLLPFCFRFIP